MSDIALAAGETAATDTETNYPKLSKRNLYTFSVGCFGRDLACSGLFVAQLLNYVYFTKSLNEKQLGVLTVLMVLARVFDALNDPIMGNIIDATKSRWGKFMPWIFAGMLGSAGVIIASFSNNLQGWDYVAFFGVMYFTWSIVFTMNDISYWGMVPALARRPQDRNKLSSTTALCAALGGGLAGIVIPILTTGDLALGDSAIKAYRLLSIIFVAVFIVIQSITIFGVNRKEILPSPPVEKVSLKLVANIFKKNDQLRWVAVVFLFTQLLPGTATTMYIYFQFGYNGTLTTLFYVFSAISTLVIYIFYPQFAKKFTRKQLITIATVSAVIGYSLTLLFGLVIPKGVASFTIPVFNATVSLQFFLIAFANLFCGFANTAFYMVLMICIANTVEYNDLKFGTRDEGVIFATRAFLNKFGTAIATLFVMLFYIIIGINSSTDKIADLEQAASLGTITGEEKMAQIGDVIASAPAAQTVGILLLITILPIILYVCAYLVYRKKYVIDEPYFDQIVKELELRNVAAAESSATEAIEESSAEAAADLSAEPDCADTTEDEHIGENPGI